MVGCPAILNRLEQVWKIDEFWIHDRTMGKFMGEKKTPKQNTYKLKGYSGPYFELRGKLAHFRCTFKSVCLSSRARTIYWSGHVGVI